MNIGHLLLLQLIAHIITDFHLQSQLKAEDKNQKGFGSSFLKWHTLMAFSLSWILSFQPEFGPAALFIAITHLLIDGFKPHWGRIKLVRKYVFFVDQALHLIMIVMMVLLFNHLFELDALIEFGSAEILIFLFAGYLLCSKTTNISIRELLELSGIVVSGGEDLPKAGRVIGIVERYLVLTFILFDQFAAIGFLIAAKSILRYRSDEAAKTEYVLVGTLISFAFAIGTGLVIRFAILQTGLPLFAT